METLRDLEMKKEKHEFRKSWTTSFLTELDLIIEKCFLRPKEKKEHFITPDKISIEFLKLLQSQKRFQPSPTTRFNLKLLAVFFTEESIVGKIKNINFETQEIEFFDMFFNVRKKNFSDLILFDIYSPELQIYFEKQKKFYDSFSYKDVFGFLTHVEKKEKTKEQTRITTVSGIQQIKLGIRIDYDK